MAALKQTIIRGGLEALYFSGAHSALRPFVGGVGAILTLHHVRPPRPDRFQPNRLLEVTPRFLSRVVTYLRRSARRSGQPRRDASPPDRGRFSPPLRLPDLRRRLPRHAAVGLSDPQRSRRAVRRLCADELSRPARRIVVACARSGDRAQRPHRPDDRRPRTEPSIARPSRRSARSTTSFTGGCARGRPRAELRARRCAILRPAIRSTSPRSARICA